jgi:hypothetical protein
MFMKNLKHRHLIAWALQAGLNFAAAGPFSPDLSPPVKPLGRQLLGKANASEPNIPISTFENGGYDVIQVTHNHLNGPCLPK